MADYVRKVGGIDHSFYATLTDENGPVDLPAGTLVTMVAWQPGSELLPIINRPGVVISPGAIVGDVDRGKVRMDPQLLDLASPGSYRVHWLAQTPGQAVAQPFPEDGWMTLLVLNAP